MVFASRVVSGVQPTGNIHLGNYLGAIKSWVKLQDQYHCLFSIADLHALTVNPEPQELKKAIKKTATWLFACGLDPDKATVFKQSDVPQHTELMWILSNLTPVNYVERLPQWKEKCTQNGRVGMLTYPILMAADILLYKGTHVPVGRDQVQHLELAQDLAKSFNRSYNEEFFPVPKLIIQEGTAKIMSLQDGRKKMSKSDLADGTRINLGDTPEMIQQKIKRATTDTERGMRYDPQSRPEVANLITIYQEMTGTTFAKACSEVKKYDFSEFKPKLADAIIAYLKPIQDRYKELIDYNDYDIDDAIYDGAEQAKEFAQDNIDDIKKLIGLR